MASFKHNVRGRFVLTFSAKAFCKVLDCNVERFVAKPKAAKTRMKAVEHPEPEKDQCCILNLRYVDINIL